MHSCWHLVTLLPLTPPTSNSMAKDHGLFSLAADPVYSHLCEVFLLYLMFLFPNMIMYSNKLHESVAGYPNSYFRCCDSIEEGTQVLDAFLAATAQHLDLSRVLNQKLFQFFRLCSL
jgi:hypothetical protein